MKKSIRFAALLLVPALSLGLGACEVQEEEEGTLPDVEVEEGAMPEYDVETGEVEVETQEETVDVPTDVDIQEPDENQQQR